MKTKIELKNLSTIKHLANEPETGMGYQVVRCRMKDGKDIDGIVENGQYLIVKGCIKESDILKIEVVK